MAEAVIDRRIDEILEQARRIAVVGLSPKPFRPSHQVARYLQSAGYEIFPVTPKATEILGRTCYGSLLDVPGPIDIVDVFRRAEFVPPVADDAIRVGARVLWLQDGIVDEGSAARARAAGLEVVMDDCLMRRHWRWRAK